MMEEYSDGNKRRKAHQISAHSCFLSVERP